MAKEPKRVSRMEAVAAINEAIRRQNIARNAALDVKAQRENVSRIRRGPSPSAVDRVLQAVRGFGSVLERAPATRSVGTPGMAPVATGEVGQLASAIGGNGRGAVQTGGSVVAPFSMEGAYADAAGMTPYIPAEPRPTYPERNAENAKARGMRLNTRTGNTSGRVGRTPFDVRDDVAGAARSVKRKIANAGNRAKQLVRQVAESANRQAESSSSPAPTVPGPAIPQNEAVRLGAELSGGLKDAGRFFVNDVGQSVKSQYGHTWELIKDPNQAGRELGEAIGTGVRTAAPFVRDTAVGVGTGLKNVATIPYDVGAGLSEGLGFDEEAADSVLEWFGAGRKSAAAKKQAEFADRRRAAEARQRQYERDENRRLLNEQLTLQNEQRRQNLAEQQLRFADNQRKSEALQRQHDEQGREYEERRLAFEGRMKQRELANATREANYRANMEALHAKKGLSVQDIQSRMANIRRAYGKDISDDQWQSATGFDPNADIGAMGRADRQRYIQALDNLAGRVDRYNQGQARQKRIQDARAYQRQIMEQRGHWSNGGFQSANRPIFTPNGMTAAQVDFSNRLKAQRMAREMSPTTAGQRAAYGQMVNNGMLTGMNIASFQGMGMQGDRLNQAIGATTGGQAYLDMRDAIAFQRDYMMKEAEMRGRRSAAAMGALGTNSLTGGNPNDPATQAAVDNVVNGTPPPTPVQTQQAAPAQTAPAPRGFNSGNDYANGGIVKQANAAMTNFREDAGLPQQEQMPDDVKKQYNF